MNTIKTTQFDTTNLKAIRADIDAALAAVAAKHGIKLATGKCTYEPSAATFKVEAATLTETGDAMTKEAVDFVRYAPLWNLSPGMLFATFTSRGESYKIIGAMPRRKAQILTRNLATGKLYTFSKDYIPAVTLQGVADA